MKTIIYFLTFFIFAMLSGCASVPYAPPEIQERISGIYHEVKRGETLWKISKAYGTGMREIATFNKLPDASRINTGQLIFIPYAEEKLETVGLHTGEDAFAWPIKGRVISFFGTFKDGVKNKGIDIAAKGGTGIAASRSGRVAFCDEKVKGFGKTVIIDHDDGYSTVYTHISEILTKTGSRVRQGSIIARVGETGRAKTPSLHFEIRKKHRPENPFYYLP